MSRISRVHIESPREPQFSPQQFGGVPPQQYGLQQQQQFMPPPPQYMQQFMTPQWVPQMRMFHDELGGYVNTDRFYSLLLGILIGLVISYMYCTSRQ